MYKVHGVPFQIPDLIMMIRENINVLAQPLFRKGSYTLQKWLNLLSQRRLMHDVEQTSKSYYYERLECIT